MTYPTQGFGAVAPSSFINDMADDLEALQTPWAPYTPTWASSGSPQPALGSGGSITAAAQKSGQIALVRMRMVLGTSPNVGNGTYSWTLPYQAIGVQQVGLGYVEYFDASASQYQSGHVAIAASALVFTILMDLGAASGYLSRAGSAAISPAAGDILVVGFAYEPA